MPRRRCVKPEEEAKEFIEKGKDKDGLDARFISAFKGRGVFAGAPFEKGDFLLEYRGELIPKKECENRQRVYHDSLQVFMFKFRSNGKYWCVDAAKDNGSLGKLVNDDHLNPNTRMRYLYIKGKPHLCLFATRNINPGEEITYNYGDPDWPWRDKQPDAEMTPRAPEAGDHEQQPDAEMTPRAPEAGDHEQQPDAEMSLRAPEAGDHEQFIIEKGDPSLCVSEGELSPVLDVLPSSRKQPDAEMTPRAPEAGDHEQQPDAEMSLRAPEAGDHEQCPKHHFAFETMSALDKCRYCLGPDQNNELDQVADFLGHDIRVHREFYRLPVPTTQLAKISKLLLSMEKGDLSGLQGRSLDEIEIEDEISFSGTEAKDSGSDSEDSSTEARGPKEGEVLGLSPGCADMENPQSSVNHEILSQVTSTAEGTVTSSEGKHAGQAEPEPRRRPKKMWSKAEVAAVMRHFGIHISKRKLASRDECNQCKQAEDPILSERTVQNIRDFVRNRITTAKRKTL